ncbi:MAG TPA: hypothetical protein PKL97_01660 [Candidatus Omnitrophota bacterium]|nr:hypothetical protein [Candidatus Omnitrophota bacterium]
MKKRWDEKEMILILLGSFLLCGFIAGSGYAENAPIGELGVSPQAVMAPSEYEPPVNVQNENEPNTVEDHQRILDGVEKLDLMEREGADLSEARDIRDEILNGGGSWNQQTTNSGDISTVIHDISTTTAEENQGRKQSETDLTVDSQASLGGGTVVDENARKNDELLKKAFSPGFLAKGIFVMPGNLTSALPKPGDIPLSLVEEGARKIRDYFKDNYLSVKRKIGKKSFDKELAERIKLLQHLQNQEAPAVADAKLRDGYITVDSVEVGKELATVYYLLHPPSQLHPYLRYLLYTRHVSPEVMRWYLLTMEKINAIYRQAKAGKGKIRYKGRIVDAYLPLPSEMGGEYELVFEQEPNRKGSVETKPLFHK